MYTCIRTCRHNHDTTDDKYVYKYKTLMTLNV